MRLNEGSSHVFLTLERADPTNPISELHLLPLLRQLLHEVSAGLFTTLALLRNQNRTKAQSTSVTWRLGTIGLRIFYEVRTPHLQS